MNTPHAAQQWAEQLEEIETQRRFLRQSEEALIAKWAEAQCPHKLGDVLTVGRSAHAFVGAQAKVYARSVRHNGRNFVWRITGVVLTKAGQRRLVNGRPAALVDWDVPIEGLDYTL